MKLIVLFTFLKCLICADSIQHPINTSILLYHSKYDNSLITIKPIERVKITTKIGLNNKQFNSILISDSFHDMEPIDVFSVIKYEIRTKFYITKRFRIAGIVQMNQQSKIKNQYLCGIYYKY